MRERKRWGVVGGLALLRKATPAFRAVAVVAVLVQLVPLGAPLLLSTDAWTYWSYGWIASEGGGNPYVDQFIHGRAEGPIETVLSISAFASTSAAGWRRWP